VVPGGACQHYGRDGIVVLGHHDIVEAELGSLRDMSGHGGPPDAHHDRLGANQGERDEPLARLSAGLGCRSALMISAAADPPGNGEDCPVTRPSAPNAAQPDVPPG